MLGIRKYSAETMLCRELALVWLLSWLAVAVFCEFIIASRAGGASEFADLGEAISLPSGPPAGSDAVYLHLESLQRGLPAEILGLRLRALERAVQGVSVV